MNPEEERIQAKIEQIVRSGGNYRQIHKEQKKKRLAWREVNKDRLHLTGFLPRQAFTMVLFEYMGLDPDEVPVFHEDETSITWRSFNFCPVLEACKRLGLDTRVVCREGYEESVQDLISCLSPNLQFSRNYPDLRPYGEYCEETIELIE